MQLLTLLLKTPVTVALWKLEGNVITTSLDVMYTQNSVDTVFLYLTGHRIHAIFFFILQTIGDFKNN